MTARSMLVAWRVPDYSRPRLPGALASRPRFGASQALRRDAHPGKFANLRRAQDPLGTRRKPKGVVLSSVIPSVVSRTPEPIARRQLAVITR